MIKADDLVEKLNLDEVSGFKDLDDAFKTVKSVSTSFKSWINNIETALKRGDLKKAKVNAGSLLAAATVLMDQLKATKG